MSEASELQKCPEAPVLKRNGFQLFKETFSVENIDRIGGSRLRELFNPSTLKLKPVEKRHAEKESRRLFKKPFFEAQLRYYGVPFQSSAKGPTLRVLLHDAVRDGKCNSVPDSVVELETSMRRDYEPLYQKWESDCAAWSDAKKRREDEAFERCKTPGEQAAFDLHRFMDRYYLTDGKPDQTKTPESLALHGFDHMTWRLSSMVREIPGLHTRSGGISQPYTHCIGWNREEVFGLAKSITDRANEAEKALRKTKWEQQLKIHQKYIARMQPNETTDGADEGSKPFDLDRCKGSYVIRCDEITNGWNSDITGHTLTMDISSTRGNMLRADFNFGVIRGTMHFSLSEDTLKGIFDEDDSGSETSSDDEEDEYDKDDEDGIDEQESTGGKKRKQSKTSIAQATGSAVSRHANAKRRKTALLPSLSRRVYLRLHGYETGEGEVLPYPDPGHIDFLSDGCATFAGLMYHLTYVGDNVEFLGYKISDQPRKQKDCIFA
ncbi:hypothetical protein ACHAQJ_005816 [Trichoderma viride]